MTITVVPINAEKIILSPGVNPKRIENHKKITSTHLEEAAKHHEFGNHKKVSQSTFIEQV